MTPAQTTALRAIYARTSPQYADRSQAFVLEVVCARAWMSHGWELDGATVAEVLGLELEREVPAAVPVVSVPVFD